MRIGILGIVMASAPWHDHASATVPWENRYGQSGMAVIAKEASGDCWKDVVAIVMMPLPKQPPSQINNPKKMPKKSPKKKVDFEAPSGPNIAESFATVLSVAHYMVPGSLAPLRKFPRFCSFSFLGIYGYYLSIYLSLFYYLIDRLYPEKPRKEMPTWWILRRGGWWEPRDHIIGCTDQDEGFGGLIRLFQTSHGLQCHHSSGCVCIVRILLKCEEFTKNCRKRYVL